MVTNIQIARLIYEVAESYGVGVAEILSDRRTQRVARARHVAAYLLRNAFELTLIETGQHLRRDHTTILYAERVVRKRMEHDERFRLRVASLTPDDPIDPTESNDPTERLPATSPTA